MASILGRLFDIARSQLDDARATEPRPRARPTSADAAGPVRGDGGDDDGPTDGTPASDDRLASYYANLEIPDGADLETARAAWRRLMKQYHPDLHSADPEKVRVANELTSRLTEAYRALEAELGNE